VATTVAVTEAVEFRLPGRTTKVVRSEPLTVAPELIPEGQRLQADWMFRKPIPRRLKNERIQDIADASPSVADIQKAPITGAFCEPEAGLEPATPGLQNLCSAS
jgi:hypothetical protein